MNREKQCHSKNSGVQGFPHFGCRGRWATAGRMGGRFPPFPTPCFPQEWRLIGRDSSRRRWRGNHLRSLLADYQWFGNSRKHFRGKYWQTKSFYLELDGGKPSPSLLGNFTVEILKRRNTAEVLKSPIDSETLFVGLSTRQFSRSNWFGFHHNQWSQ